MSDNTEPMADRRTIHVNGPLTLEGKLVWKFVIIPEQIWLWSATKPTLLQRLVCRIFGIEVSYHPIEEQ